jgi:hypothetical protein
MSGDYVIKYIVFIVCLAIAVPLIDQLAHALVVPAIVGGVLYLAVRLVNAYLNRW